MYVPVAVNGCVVPFAMLGSAGVTPIDTSAAALTVNVVLPLGTAPLSCGDSHAAKAGRGCQAVRAGCHANVIYVELMEAEEARVWAEGE